MDVSNSTVQLNTSDGKMDAYVAQPKDGGSYAGVVVIQEAFGINDHMKKVTERIAAEGYVAICRIFSSRDRAGDSVFRYGQGDRGHAAGARPQGDGRCRRGDRPFRNPEGNVKAGLEHPASSALRGRPVLPIWPRRVAPTTVKCAVPYYGRRRSDGQPEPAVAHRRDQMSHVCYLFESPRDQLIPLDQVNQIKTELATKRVRPLRWRYIRKPATAFSATSAAAIMKNRPPMLGRRPRRSSRSI